MGNRFRMLINEVNVVATDKLLPSLPVARAFWEPLPDLKVSAAAWIYAGGAHHTGFSQVVFFQDKRALSEFIGGNFEFGAEAQATILTAAAGATANTGGSSATASGGKNNAAIGSSGYNKGMATFTITKGGLMYEASIGGQKFSFTSR